MGHIYLSSEEVAEELNTSRGGVRSLARRCQWGSGTMLDSRGRIMRIYALDDIIRNFPHVAEIYGSGANPRTNQKRSVAPEVLIHHPQRPRIRRQFKRMIKNIAQAMSLVILFWGTIAVTYYSFPALVNRWNTWAAQAERVAPAIAQQKESAQSGSFMSLQGEPGQYNEVSIPAFTPDKP